MKKKNVLFISGQGCQTIDEALGESWQDSFEFIPLENDSFEGQARRLAQKIIDDGRSDLHIVGHSAGCIVAMLTAIFIKEMTGGLCGVRRLTLLAPPALLGQQLPWSVTWKMLRNPRYWTKGLPGARPFKITRGDSDRLMFGPDTPDEIKNRFFDHVSKVWFPRLITENFLSPFTAWKHFDWATKLKGIDMLVMGGTCDGLIPLSLCKETAGRIGALFMPINGASHLGMLFGKSGETLLKLLMTEREYPTWTFQGIKSGQGQDKNPASIPTSQAFA